MEKKGICFETLVNELPVLRNKGVENARTFFSIIQKQYNENLNWEEFLEAMKLLNVRSNNDKMTLFSLLAD